MRAAPFLYRARLVGPNLEGFLGHSDRAGGGGDTGRQGHWGGRCDGRPLGDRRALDGKCQTQAESDAGQMSTTSAAGYTDQCWQKGTEEAKDDESRMPGRQKTAVCASCQCCL
jgi:hypothetical protein